MAYTGFIIDDEELVLNRLALGFDWNNTEFDVIATFMDSTLALEQIGLLQPDVVLSDIKMPKLDGLSLMEKAKAISPHTKFVFISGHQDFHFVKRALSLGAFGYCIKPIEDEELSDCLQKVATSLTDVNLYLESLLCKSLDTNCEATAMQLYEKLKNIKQLNTLHIAVSVGDIHEQLLGYTDYTMLTYDNNVFFYFIEHADFLDSVGFQRNLRTLFAQQKLKSFQYCNLLSSMQFYKTILYLLNHAFTYFMSPTHSFQSSYRISFENNTTDHTFFSLLEKAIFQNNYIDIAELLKNYHTLYPPIERNIHEILTIYNVVMQMIYQKNNCFFDEPFTRNVINLKKIS